MEHIDLNHQFNLIIKQCESINLKKLKLDTLLIVINHLLSDYKQMQLPKDENDTKVIFENIKNLKDYLDKNVISIQMLSYIFQNENKSVLLKKISTSLTPMRAYYKFLTSIFSSQVKNGSYWIPELLAFSLIHNYKKEFNKSFGTHHFIEKFPTEKILEIYNQNNLLIKKYLKDKDTNSIWKIKTNLDEMYDLSEITIKKYLQYNYKINKKRVSKTRKK